MKSSAVLPAAAEGRIQQRLADRASAATTAKVVQSKLERGQQTAEKGRFNRYKDGEGLFYSCMLLSFTAGVYWCP
jgi:hypothetical protein